jgi:DNA relaxase NicK
MMNNEELVKTFVEVLLTDSENFLKIKETLTRIGISSKKENKLYQSCHILHKKGKYYIVHFKELFALDGLAGELSEQDKARRNTIANLLVEWGLVKIVNMDIASDPIAPLNHMKILPHAEKKNWELVPKYSIGKKFTPKEE